MLNSSRKAVSPVIAIVLLLMMTVAAAGAAYFWITSMQSSVQQSAGSQIEAITKSVSTRIIPQATICKGVNEVNLKGYWKMNEGEGNYANDSSKYENDGTLEDSNLSDTESPQGPDWVSGKIGKALSFDGNDDWVDTGTNTLIYESNSEPWTISAFVKVSGWTGGAQTIIDYRSRYHIQLSSSGTVVSTPGGNGFSWGYSLDKGKWYHLSIKYDGNGNVYCYVNGKQVRSVGGVNPYESSLTSTLQFGAHTYGGRWFNGTIDEVRIYNRALSKAQVEYLNDTNRAMGRYVDITVYNAGTEEVPEGAWVANLKKDGTTVDSDSYNASKLPSEERITLNFYFDKMKPNKEHTIELEGTETSTTVSC